MGFRVEYDPREWTQGQNVKVVPWMQGRYPVGDATGTVRVIRGVAARVAFRKGRQTVEQEVDLAHLEKAAT
jgi:hypothetical protein